MNPTLQSWRAKPPPTIAWKNSASRSSCNNKSGLRSDFAQDRRAATVNGTQPLARASAMRPVTASVRIAQESQKMLDTTTRLAVQINSEAGSL